MTLAPIQEDATIGVFTPAAEADKFSVRRILETFAQTGFKFVFDRSLLMPIDGIVDRPVSLSTLTADELRLNPREKAASFHRLVEDDRVDLIWAYDGPKGSVATLQHIDWDIVRKNPKTVVGFSDVTAFLNAITAKTGIPTFCAENLSGASAKSINFQTLVALLSGEKISLTDEFANQAYFMSAAEARKCDATSPIMRTLHPGNATGPLVGGNLTRLCELHESGITPNYDDAVLFLEDTGETAETIGRHLESLNDQGVLASISALMLGDFDRIDGKEKHLGQSLSDLFANLVSTMAGQEKPCIVGLPTGHVRLPGNKPRRLFPLPIGTNVILNAADDVISLELDPFSVV